MQNGYKSRMFLISIYQRLFVITLVLVFNAALIMEGLIIVDNGFNKKISDLMGKMDDKMLKMKINSAIDMLKKGNTEELAKKIGKMDKDELLDKINDFDSSKLENLKLNKQEIKNTIDDADLEKLKNMIGDQGDELVKKFKEFMGA